MISKSVCLRFLVIAAISAFFSTSSWAIGEATVFGIDVEPSGACTANESAFYIARDTANICQCKAGTWSCTTPASGGSGDVVGPVSSIDNEICRFNGVTGAAIQGTTTLGPKITDNGGLTVSNGGLTISSAGTDADAIYFLENSTTCPEPIVGQVALCAISGKLYYRVNGGSSTQLADGP